MFGLSNSQRSGKLLFVSTISIDDLKTQTAAQWLKSADQEDLIVTSQGQPVAVLLPINAESLEATLGALRSVRAVQAQTALQRGAAVGGISNLSMDDIDAEIMAARKNRSRK